MAGARIRENSEGQGDKAPVRWRWRRRKRTIWTRVADLFRRHERIAVFGERRAGKTTLIHYLQKGERIAEPEETNSPEAVKAKGVVIESDDGSPRAVRTYPIYDMGGDESYLDEFLAEVKKASLILYLIPAHKLGLPHELPDGSDSTVPGSDDNADPVPEFSKNLEPLILKDRYKRDLDKIVCAAHEGRRKRRLCIVITHTDKLSMPRRFWAYFTDRVRNTREIRKVLRNLSVFDSAEVVTGSLKNDHSAARIAARILRFESADEAS